MPAEYLLPEELGNEVMQYLACQPYKEVFVLIDKMRALAKYEPPELPAAE